MSDVKMVSISEEDFERLKMLASKKSKDKVRSKKPDVPPIEASDVPKFDFKEIFSEISTDRDLFYKICAKSSKQVRTARNWLTRNLPDALDEFETRLAETITEADKHEVDHVPRSSAKAAAEDTRASPVKAVKASVETRICLNLVSGHKTCRNHKLGTCRFDHDEERVESFKASDIGKEVIAKYTKSKDVNDVNERFCFNYMATGKCLRSSCSRKSTHNSEASTRFKKCCKDSKGLADAFKKFIDPEAGGRDDECDVDE
jgi:hypothetical protein